MAKRSGPSPPKAPQRGSTAKRSGAVAISASSIRATKPKLEPETSHISDEPVSDDLQTIFGENLRAARLKCGLKQSEMAERTGFSQQRLSLIESGQQNLTLKTMTKLAHAIDHDVIAMLQKMSFDNDTD